MHNIYNYLQYITWHLLILEWESNHYVFSQMMCRSNGCIPNGVKLFLAWTGNYDSSLNVMNAKIIKKLVFLYCFFHEN